jgi:hypothetical protein
MSACLSARNDSFQIDAYPRLHAQMLRNVHDMFLLMHRFLGPDQDSTQT